MQIGTNTSRFTSYILLGLAYLFSALPAVSQTIPIPAARDPKYNSAINPKYNSNISPRYNTSIDPKYNTSIDPKYTTSIDPKYNTSLDPNYNLSLDPTKSRWSGYYVFDLDADLLGVVVRANDKFLLLYDLRPRWTGYFVSNGKNGFNWFTKDGEWLGYLVSNSENGFNLFSTEGKWLGFLN